MPIFGNFSPLKEKILTSALCVLGISAIVYGMTTKNNLFFIIGIMLVIAVYIIIRKKLRESIKK